ncbi:MAG: tRNA adenylyltransferase, partial [Clostridium cochlearium]|nr:tRNA adenylyltransferase [Clostridium cochlearium]
MEMEIPNYVKSIMGKLEAYGYETYIVGGAIRNILLNKKPKDYDISTSATPDEIEEVFSDYKTIGIGKKFGTIVVSQREGDVEITTFRKEGNYIDGRRPEWISFSNNVIEDLSRRDFTINAMAYNVENGLFDPFGGKEDLEKRLIKTVG